MTKIFPSMYFIGVLLVLGQELHPVASFSLRWHQQQCSSVAPLLSPPLTVLNFKMEQTDNTEAELRRKEYRTLYNHDDWVEHRKPGRFLEEFRKPLTRALLWIVYFFALGVISGNIKIVIHSWKGEEDKQGPGPRGRSNVLVVVVARVSLVKDMRPFNTTPSTSPSLLGTGTTNPACNNLSRFSRNRWRWAHAQHSAPNNNESIVIHKERSEHSETSNQLITPLPFQSPKDARDHQYHPFCWRWKKSRETPTTTEAMAFLVVIDENHDTRPKGTVLIQWERGDRVYTGGHTHCLK